MGKIYTFGALTYVLGRVEGREKRHFSFHFCSDLLPVGRDGKVETIDARRSL
jgi:hypothetical protein